MIFHLLVRHHPFSIMILCCYYLDEPLTDDELQFVLQTLVGPWARFKTGANSLRQVRVPAVLPTPGPNGSYTTSREQRAEIVRGNLRHANIAADAGHQVVWIMPKNFEWDAIFQFALREETGFGPFVVQRWFMENSRPVRRDIRIVDTNLLLQNL